MHALWLGDEGRVHATLQHTAIPGSHRADRARGTLSIVAAMARRGCRARMSERYENLNPFPTPTRWVVLRKGDTDGLVNRLIAVTHTPKNRYMS